MRQRMTRNTALALGFAFITGLGHAQTSGTISPVIFVPADETVRPDQVQQVRDGLRLLKEWYARELGDRELNMKPLVVASGTQTADVYRGGAIWSEAPREIEPVVGHPPWSAGHVNLILGRGTYGWAGGAGIADRGRAVVGLESLLEPWRCAGEWWCNPETWVGTTIHELGHGLTLPHSEGRSIMSSHVDYGNKVLIETPQFPERTTVRSSIFTRSSIGFTSLLVSRTTALTATSDQVDFLVADFNRDGVVDLYAVRKNGASGRTEVDVLDGARNYSTFLVRGLATALHRTDASYAFKAGDYDADGITDLFVIKMRGGSGRTEIHVLNGANRFRSFLLHAASALHTTDASWAFDVGDYNRDGAIDVYAIKKKGGSGKTEVHVLNGANGFRSFLLHTATALHQTGAGYEFALGDYDSDGWLDLYTIKKQGGSRATEVHVLDGASGFGRFSLNVASALPPTDDSYVFAVGDYDHFRRSDVFAIHRDGSQGTEIRVLP